MCGNHGNRGVVYMGENSVEVQPIAYPELMMGKRACQHGVILKVITTNICGSDQHMVRGRTTAEAGLVLGHEITGQIIECGRDVEFLEVGDIVSVPFNIACGISPPKQAVEQIKPSLYFFNNDLSIHGRENIPLPLTPFKWLRVVNLTRFSYPI